MSNMIEIKNLNKKFKLHQLKNINITLKKGEVLGIVGKNGAGKTTLIKLIMNMIDKTSGEIEVFGKDNQKHEIEIKQNIGYVPAEDYFILNSTLKQHAEAFKLFYNIWDNELFNDLCEMWNLNKSQKIYKYSTGMKTKAMLALALAHKPKLLILDEPTSGLDPIAREKFWK